MGLGLGSGFQFIHTHTALLQPLHFSRVPVIVSYLSIAFYGKMKGLHGGKNGTCRKHWLLPSTFIFLFQEPWGGRVSFALHLSYPALAEWIQGTRTACVCMPWVLSHGNGMHVIYGWTDRPIWKVLKIEDWINKKSASEPQERKSDSATHNPDKVKSESGDFLKLARPFHITQYVGDCNSLLSRGSRKRKPFSRKCHRTTDRANPLTLPRRITGWYNCIESPIASYPGRINRVILFKGRWKHCLELKIEQCQKRQNTHILKLFPAFSDLLKASRKNRMESSKEADRQETKCSPCLSLSSSCFYWRTNFSLIQGLLVSMFVYWNKFFPEFDLLTKKFKLLSPFRH